MVGVIMRTVANLIGFFTRKVVPRCGPVQTFTSKIKLREGITIEEINSLGQDGIEDVATKLALPFCRTTRWQKTWLSDYCLEYEVVEDEKAA